MTVRHLVLIKSDDPGRVDEILSRIPPMTGSVPYLAAVEVGRDAGTLAQGFTRCLLMTFTHEDGLRAWAEHPPHGPVRDDLLACSEMIAIDYAVGGGCVDPA